MLLIRALFSKNCHGSWLSEETTNQSSFFKELLQFMAFSRDQLSQMLFDLLQFRDSPEDSLQPILDCLKRSCNSEIDQKTYHSQFNLKVIEMLTTL